MQRILLWLAASLLASAALLCLAGWAWYATLDLELEPRADRHATAASLTWLPAGTPPSRGRILAVVTSAGTYPGSDKRAGYELTELSRAWWVFTANGYAVDIASPAGGKPVMVLDGDDVTDADYAFLNDTGVRRQLEATIPLADVDASDYAAVYFVGGKGTMFDFPGNPHIARIVATIDAAGGVIGAVCHGPAALVGLRRDDGTPWLQGRRVAGFSNAEELFLMADARERFPFLLQDGLIAEGGRYVEAPMYLYGVAVDDRLVTGQNPWSTWGVAEEMVRALGHAPHPRPVGPDEISIALLGRYRADGFDAAVAAKAAAPRADKHLLVMHAVVAAMQGDLHDAWQLQRLARR